MSTRRQAWIQITTRGSWGGLAALLWMAALKTNPADGAGAQISSDPQQPTTNLLTRVGPQLYRLNSILIERDHRTITFPGEFNVTDQVIEYALVTTEGKTHESLLKTTVAPRDLHIACLLLGIVPAAQLGETNRMATFQTNSVIRVQVNWMMAGQKRSHALEALIGLGAKDSLSLTGRLASTRWLYNGSLLDQGVFVAQAEGSIISLIRDPAALLNNPGPDRDNDDIHYPDRSLVPPKGTPVQIEFHF